MVNVLEHIEDDRAALSGLARVVVPGGHVLIFLPALSMLMRRMDHDLGHFRRCHRKDPRRLTHRQHPAMSKGLLENRPEG